MIIKVAKKIKKKLNKGVTKIKVVKKSFLN